MKAMIFTLDALFALIIATASISILLYFNFSVQAPYAIAYADAQGILTNLLSTPVDVMQNSSVLAKTMTNQFTGANETWPQFMGGVQENGSSAIGPIKPILSSIYVATNTITTSVIADYGNIYFAANNIVYALNATTGRLVWSKYVVSNVVYTPALYLGLLIFANSSYVVALNAVTGTQTWRTSIASQTASPITVYGALAMFGSADSKIVALNANNGTLTWSNPVESVPLGILIAGGSPASKTSTNTIFTETASQTGAGELVSKSFYSNALTNVAAQGDAMYFGSGNSLNMMVVNGTMPVSSTYSTITRVQGNARGTTTTSTLIVTLSAAPTNGDLLVLCYGSTLGTPITVNSISQTGVTWTKQISSNQAWANGEIWAGVVSAGASQTVTLTLSGTPTYSSTADVSEYNGLATTNFLDKTATWLGTGPTGSTGTTATTSQASELWIGCMALGASGSSQSNPQNSFTLMDGALQSPYLSVGYLEYIASSTGAASSGTTGGSGGDAFSGCIATFKAASQSTSSGPLTFSQPITGVALQSNRVIAQTTNSVVAAAPLNAITLSWNQTVFWNVAVPPYFGNAIPNAVPVIAGKNVYTLWKNGLAAQSVTNGTVLWFALMPNANTMPYMTVAYGRLYVVAGTKIFTFGSCNSPIHASAFVAVASMNVNGASGCAAALSNAVYPAANYTVSTGNTISNSINAASFDGSAHYMAASNSGPLNSSYVSASFWVNISSYPGSGARLVNYGDTGLCYFVNACGWFFYLASNGLIEFSVMNVNQTTVNSIILSKNKWYQITGTYDGANVKLYVNGGLPYKVARVGVMAATSPNINLTIGTGLDAKYFTGNIANLQVYNRSLTNPQVQQLYVRGIQGVPLQSAGLVAWYPLAGDTNDYAMFNPGYNAGVGFVAQTYTPPSLANTYGISRAGIVVPLLNYSTGSYRLYQAGVYAWR